MITLTALYPYQADSRFDLAYYLNTHTPLVRERLTPMGLTDIEVEQGLAGGIPDSPPTYTLIGRLRFNTLEQFQAAMGAHSAELMGDIPNFTDVQPVMQISQIV